MKTELPYHEQERIKNCQMFRLRLILPLQSLFVRIDKHTLLRQVPTSTSRRIDMHARYD